MPGAQRALAQRDLIFDVTEMNGPDTHLHFMAQAIALAEQAATLGEVPVGAVVVNAEGRVLASAHNTRETQDDPCGHAELIAMREAAKAQGHWRLDGCTVYVTLEPCAMCAGAMVLSRIQTCVYGADDPKAGFCGSVGDLSAHPKLNHSFELVSGVLAEECSDLLRSFFAELRARKRAAKANKPDA